MIPSVYDILDEAANSVAEPIKQLFSMAEVPHYANLLSMLSWFTDGTYFRYMIEANRDTNAPELRKAFRDHGITERDHYQYALKDLEALGFVRNPALPEEVHRLHQQVDRWDAPAKLGCSASIETMSGLLAKDAIAMKTRLQLTEHQFKFIGLHLEADTGPGGHADELRVIAEKHLSGKQWVGFIEGALIGSRLWGDMITSALKSPLYASRSFRAEI